MRVGVLGGTFDPPHIAHLAAGAAAKHHLGLDRVFFVPAGDPWRKADRPVSPAAARLRMLRAALGPLPWAEVSTVEVDRPGPSYTVDTFDELTRVLGPGVEWWFIAGDDALADMPNWREPERLLQLARIALVRRTPGDRAVFAEVASRLPGLRSRLDIVPMLALDVSSTDLRERVRAGRSTTILVPEAVRTVIDELNLYR